MNSSMLSTLAVTMTVHKKARARSESHGRSTRCPERLRPFTRGSARARMGGVRRREESMSSASVMKDTERALRRSSEAVSSPPRRTATATEAVVRGRA